MASSGIQTVPGDRCSTDAFQGEPGADNICGEALLDLLFDRAHAIGQAAERGGDVSTRLAVLR
jgi:hypothetical protein